MQIKNSARYGGLALVVAASLSLAACGGSSSDKKPGPQFSSSSEGVASKGILRNAIVHAVELDASGRELRELNNTRTDAEGRYALSIGSSYTNGPVLFRLTADGDTRMVCDVPIGCGNGIGFGGEVPLGSNFRLKAVVPSISANAPVTAQLTPFTTMAAERILRGGRELSPANVTLANEAVSAIVGVNILATEPVDLTSASVGDASEEARQYATFLAGVGHVAYESDRDVSEVVAGLAEGFRTGSMSADAPVKITEITAAVAAVAAAEQVKAHVPLKVTNQVEALNAQVNPDGSFTPVVRVDGNTSELEQAKALVEEARTLAVSLAELEDPLSAFRFDLELAEEVINDNAVALIELVAIAGEAVLGAFEAEELKIGDENKKVALAAFEGESSAELTVSVTESAAGTVFAIHSIAMPQSDDVELQLTIQTSLKLSEFLGEDAVELDGASLVISGRVQNRELTLRLDEIDLAVALQEKISIDPATLQAVTKPRFTAAALTGAVEIAATREWAEAGAAADSGAGEGSEPFSLGVGFRGELEVEFVTLAAGQAPLRDNQVSLKNLGVSGTFSGPQHGTFSARAKLSVDNAASFDTFALLDHEPFIMVADWVEGDALGAVAYAQAEFAEFAGLEIDGARFEIGSFRSDNDPYGTRFWKGTLGKR